MNRQVLIIGVIAVLVVAILIFALGPTPEEPAPETAPPVATSEERAEDARTVIAALQEADDVDYDLAFERAQEFQRAGELADAQMMLFFGARGGHARSAFELGTLNDPNHHDPAVSLMAEPDAFQAYRWYNVAREQGMTAAVERLDALRAWAEKASEAGDADAEQLLLQWE